MDFNYPYLFTGIVIAGISSVLFPGVVIFPTVLAALLVLTFIIVAFDLKNEKDTPLKSKESEEFGEVSSAITGSVKNIILSSENKTPHKNQFRIFLVELMGSLMLCSGVILVFIILDILKRLILMPYELRFVIFYIEVIMWLTLGITILITLLRIPVSLRGKGIAIGQNKEPKAPTSDLTFITVTAIGVVFGLLIGLHMVLEIFINPSQINLFTSHIFDLFI